MRKAVLAVTAFAIVVLLVASALDEREIAYPTGLPAARVAAVLGPGARTCWPVEAPVAFSAVRLVTAGGGPLEVSAGGRAGRTPAGGGIVTARLGRVAAGRVRVCARNAGTGAATLYGAPPDTRVRLLGEPDAKVVPAAVLLRAEPTTLLAQIPHAVARAARFDGGWIGTWAVWALLALVAVGVPALLARALYASERSSSGTGSRRSSPAERVS
jgi:hypothetical protein